MAAAKYLIRRGASPAARDGPLTDGMLPEAVASMWGDEEVAGVLKAALAEAHRRARESATSPRGRTPV